MKNIYKALAAFQQEVPIIHKDTSGYGYTYADLPQILGVINPLLKKHGLGFTQPIIGDTIKTIVFHTETGEQIESQINIPQGVALAKMNEFQVLGSGITYLRRYALSSILGLVTDKDTDAAGEQRDTAKSKTEKEKPWLTVNSESWDILVKRVERGEEFTISQIEKKYKIRKEEKDLLNSMNIF